MTPDNLNQKHKTISNINEDRMIILFNNLVGIIRLKKTAKTI